MDISSIIVAVLALVGTLAGSLIGSNKTEALVVYRLNELEKKVEKHNKVIDRTYHLEEVAALYEEKVKVINHRLDDLEHGKAGE